jgi:hypothetical protein
MPTWLLVVGWKVLSLYGGKLNKSSQQGIAGIAGTRALAGEPHCFWEALKQRRGKQVGTRAMIEALLLGRQYGYPALKEALEKAMDLSCFDVEALRLLLTAKRSGKREPSETVEIGAWQSYDRNPPPKTLTIRCRTSSNYTLSTVFEFASGFAAAE